MIPTCYGGNSKNGRILSCDTNIMPLGNSFAKFFQGTGEQKTCWLRWYKPPDVTHLWFAAACRFCLPFSRSLPRHMAYVMKELHLARRLLQPGRCLLAAERVCDQLRSKEVRWNRLYFQVSNLPMVVVEVAGKSKGFFVRFLEKYEGLYRCLFVLQRKTRSQCVYNRRSLYFNIEKLSSWLN